MLIEQPFLIKENHNKEKGGNCGRPYAKLSPKGK